MVKYSSKPDNSEIRGSFDLRHSFRTGALILETVKLYEVSKAADVYNSGAVNGGEQLLNLNREESFELKKFKVLIEILRVRRKILSGSARNKIKLLRPQKEYPTKKGGPQ